MEEGIVIPVVMFLSIAVVTITYFYFKSRARADKQQTIRLALEKGSELSPEFLKQLGEEKPAGDKDLRRGVIFLALASGLVLIGFAVPEPEALRGLLAGAALPFSIGAAFLLMHWYSDKKE